MATHLTRRSGVYYLCRSIPQNLIDGFGGDPLRALWGGPHGGGETGQSR
ncbi:hypothetical protein B0O95_105124 [Mycetohabitans endofungorum]|uniref:Uncharacterized protein n=1 Tax=Mycetohabitans endofungorum TaxID=417203 RepID=A0A2P5KB68_9BURK|nr:hypothetical protein B0O95_105124 [Mycetohabitans endofungorum]